MPPTESDLSSASHLPHASKADQPYRGFSEDGVGQQAARMVLDSISRLILWMSRLSSVREGWVSGRLLEHGICRYYLQRCQSQRAMKKVRQRVNALTDRCRATANLRDVIAALNPIMRGWGNYFRIGNAAIKFNRSIGMSRTDCSV